VLRRHLFLRMARIQGWARLREAARLSSLIKLLYSAGWASTFELSALLASDVCRGVLLLSGGLSGILCLRP
jgi:hypothetical protein